MSELDCEQLEEIAAELALGLLGGHERADAAEHLANCPSCRAHVGALAAVGDGLLGLVPGVEPPVGFEQRVLGRLGIGHRPARGRWLPLAVAAAVAALVFGLGGWAIGGLTSTPSVSAAAPLHSASLISADHQRIGEVFAYEGRYPWVYMAVDSDTGTRTVRCDLELRGGGVAQVGTFTLSGGDGYWAAPARVDPATVVGARLVLSNGTVWATAVF